MFAASPPLRACLVCGWFLLLHSRAPAVGPDAALIVREAVLNLASGQSYRWEVRDLDGEVTQKTVWREPAAGAGTGTSATAGERTALARKVNIRLLSPTVQGELRTDGWALATVGFDEGPRVFTVIGPEGTRVALLGSDEWQAFGKFQAAHRDIIAQPSLLHGDREQKLFSAGWAAFTSPLPHVLLPKLLRMAEHFRFEGDEIVADVGVAGARLLLGAEGLSRRLAPERFKGTTRLRVREGRLRECRIVLDYDVDRGNQADPQTESVDLLIFFTGPSDQPPVIPAAARSLLAGG